MRARGLCGLLLPSSLCRPDCTSSYEHSSALAQDWIGDLMSEGVQIAYLPAAPARQWQSLGDSKAVSS